MKRNQSLPFKTSYHWTPLKMFLFLFHRLESFEIKKWLMFIFKCQHINYVILLKHSRNEFFNNFDLFPQKYF